MWASISRSDRLTQWLMLARNIVEEVVFMLFFKTTSGNTLCRRYRKAPFPFCKERSKTQASTNANRWNAHGFEIRSSKLNSV